MVLWILGGLFAFAMFGHLLQKHEDATTDYCQGLNMDTLYEDRSKYKELTDQADMLERQTKNLYKQGQITYSQLQEAKDSRYNISKYWLKVEDCIEQRG